MGRRKPGVQTPFSYKPGRGDTGEKSRKYVTYKGAKNSSSTIDRRGKSTEVG